MKAIRYEQFQGPLSLVDVPDPVPTDDGVVVELRATGLCRSDWHGWMGHDTDIQLPHVPGHELAGVVVERGAHVATVQIGDRITVPFSMGCGKCNQCLSANHQVCDDYFQPGFTAWGSFAQLVALPHAEINLVKLPEEMDFVTATSLGCRFITSYRAVSAQGKIKKGDWLAVHGCGGVGLSAIMIGNALGARVIAVDVNQDALTLAKELGAELLLDGRGDDLPEQIKDCTSGGADVSIDALGSTHTCLNSIGCLRKRGRHVQVGLMTADAAHPSIPMATVIAHELEILGSHGMSASDYPQMLDLIQSKNLHPERLVTRRIRLGELETELPRIGEQPVHGITVVDRFD